MTDLPEIVDPRVDPPYVDDERPLLEAWLEWHRATLLVKCQDLSDEQLKRRSVPPSSLSLLGLVRHMADVERNWFQRVLGGDDLPGGLYWTDDHPDGDFDDVDEADADADFATLQTQVEIARQRAAAATLDTTGVRRGEPVSLRWIYIHMIEEYARHNGHADFLRECIDGATGD